MINELKEKFKILHDKLKKIKHIHLYIALGLACLVVAFYLLSLQSTDEKESSSTNDNNRTEFSTSAEYIDYLENKLENVITSLKGVGETEVVVTLEKGFEYIYQTAEETRTSSNGTTVTSSHLVLVDGQPVITEEIYPVVKGIVVIADGSSDVTIKLDIINLILTMVDIDTSQIKIMEGE